MRLQTCGAIMISKLDQKPHQCVSPVSHHFNGHKESAKEELIKPSGITTLFKKRNISLSTKQIDTSSFTYLTSLFYIMPFVHVQLGIWHSLCSSILKITSAFVFSSLEKQSIYKIPEITQFLLQSLCSPTSCFNVPLLSI